MRTSSQDNRLIVYGKHDEATVKQIENCLAVGNAYRAILCADGHKGYGHPIGGVVAYKDHISLSGVGFDIGCGNLAVRTNLRVQDMLNNIGIERVMDHIASTVCFGIGTQTKRWGHDETQVDRIVDLIKSLPNKEVSSLAEMAKQQLGTVGGGNHYVDIFGDQEGFVWVGIHFGSRGFGHKTAKYFMGLAGAKDSMDDPPCLLEANSTIGQNYIKAMTVAGEYAMIGRQLVAHHVTNDILSATVSLTIHNHHNFAWQEQHDGELYWVVRKGATPAFPGQRGFVGGSMGDDAYIVEGIDSPISRENLYSTVHGAGRIMSRTEAKGKTKKGKVIKEGKITSEQQKEWLKQKGVCLRGGDVDEAPQAYRRLDDVIAEHSDSIRVLHKLTPLGVAMASPKDFDPYKD